MAKQRDNVLIVMAVMLIAIGPAQATSHVRIVRLSYEDGKVQMDRTAGQGLDRAILNSPIVEGSRIVTGTDGLAEVEFENNSTVRLGEATEVVFRLLLINDAGDKVNEVALVRGTMYFDTRSGKDDIYRVIAASRTFVLRHDSRVRFLMSGDKVQAAVLNGEAQFDNNAQLARIKKSDTLTVDENSPERYVVAKGLDKLPLDSWNNERAAYQNVYSYDNFGYGSRSLSAFGYQDLAYYGGFLSVPGYGLVWQPYGASTWLGWDPYISGAWAFTPGFGYVWASAYPWGWLPYHYGSWAYQPLIGWFWCPGNSFNHGGAVTNWQATAPVMNGPTGYSPPTPPVTTSVNRPSVLVGQIGRMPAYLPGGPVPPNFRSVITDHSSLAGVAAPLTAGAGGAGGASAATRGAWAVNFRSVNSTLATGSSFTSPRGRAEQGGVAHNNSGGHVFVTPQPTVSSGRTSGGFGSPATPSYGRGGASMQSTGGTGHGTGMGAGNAGGGGSPK
jgi:hypothetical protein